MSIMLFLLLGTHIFFTIKLKFIQKMLPLGMKLSFSKSEPANNGITPYEALSTALAATIGTGNIIGISIAIAIGGPGAVFWCWLAGFLGIATCYAESYLSSKYHVKNENGAFLGGPMYVLKNVLHLKYIAVFFAIFTVLASLGIGSSVQANSIQTAISAHFNISPHIIGITISLLAGFVVLGGVKQIAKVCTILVPFMSLLYLSACAYLLIQNREFLLDSILVILKSAFSAKSYIGGFTGASVLLALRTGISKGLFTNEAGLGSIPITAAATNCSSTIKQGLISMTGPFWDTVVICAITGIVIVSSMLRHPIDYVNLPADKLCFAAFLNLPCYGSELLSLCLVLFAFATIIGWCYYGECSMRFLLGERWLSVYHTAYIVSIYLGTVIPLDLVWKTSELLNYLMALPNLLCLYLLRNVITSPPNNLTNQ